MSKRPVSLLPPSLSMKVFGQDPELFYLAGGAAAAFVMAVLRSFQYTRKQFVLRLVEAFMCSMLTASFAVSLHAFWDLSFVTAIPLGTVIGFLGTDLIHGIIVSLLEFYTSKHTGADLSARGSHHFFGRMGHNRPHAPPQSNRTANRVDNPDE